MQDGQSRWVTHRGLVGLVRGGGVDDGLRGHFGFTMATDGVRLMGGVARGGGEEVTNLAHARITISQAGLCDT